MLSRPIPRYAAIAERLARVGRRLEAARMLVWRAAWMADIEHAERQGGEHGEGRRGPGRDRARASRRSRSAARTARSRPSTRSSRSGSATSRSTTSSRAPGTSSASSSRSASSATSSPSNPCPCPCPCPCPIPCLDYPGRGPTSHSGRPGMKSGTGTGTGTGHGSRTTSLEIFLRGDAPRAHNFRCLPVGVANRSDSLLRRHAYVSSAQERGRRRGGRRPLVTKATRRTRRRVARRRDHRPPAPEGRARRHRPFGRVRRGD